VSHYSSTAVSGVATTTFVHDVNATAVRSHACAADHYTFVTATTTAATVTATTLSQSQQSAVLSDYRALRDFISNKEMDTIKQRAINQEFDRQLDFGRTRRRLQSGSGSGSGNGSGSGSGSGSGGGGSITVPPTTPAGTVAGTVAGTTSGTTSGSATGSAATPAAPAAAEPQPVFVPPPLGELTQLAIILELLFW
jgi:hypothetical protein